MFLAKKFGKGDKRGMIVGIGIEIRVDCTGVHDELLSIVFPSVEEFSRFEIMFFDKKAITGPSVSVFLEQADHCSPFLEGMDLYCHIGFDFHVQITASVSPNLFSTKANFTFLSRFLKAISMELF